MTFAQVNEEITEDQSEVKALQQEILRLRMLLLNNGIEYRDNLRTAYSYNTGLDTTKEINSNGHSVNNDSGIDATGIINIASTYYNDQSYHAGGDVDQTMEIESKHEATHYIKEDYSSSNTAKGSEIVDNSSTYLQRMACTKMVDALGAVLVKVDSFLKTINFNPHLSREDLSSDNSSLYDRNDSIHHFENRIQDSRMQGGLNNDLSDIKRDHNDSVPVASITEVGTEFKIPVAPASKGNVFNRTPGKSLSSLLERRLKLKGTRFVNEGKDIELKEELKKARRQKEQKLQLRQWLLEKETKAENAGALYNEQFK